MVADAIGAALTTEQTQYGGGWDTCSRCGVKDRADQLAKTTLGGQETIVHKDEHHEKCMRWREERAANPTRNGVHK